MKKFIIFLCACIIGFFNVNPMVTVYAASKTNNAEQELETTISDQLNNLNFSGLDTYIADLSKNYDFIKTTNFKELVSQITNGDYFSNYSSVFEAVLNLLIGNLKNVIPLLFLIVAIAVLGSIVNSLKSDKVSGGVGDLIHFVCYGIVVLILVGSISHIISLTSSCINSMLSQMQIIFPIMLTLLVSVGGVVSVGIYKPIVSVLTQVVGFIFSKLLFPLFIISFIFLVIGNLSNNIKLDKFNSFFSSLFKWSVGFIFTMFSAFLTIQGISAGKFDGISIKATKFAVKSYIPLIGGYISDGFDLIMGASVIIKNAVGVAGLFLIFANILKPIIYIMALKLGLQLVSAVLEPMGDGRIGNFTSGCSKILTYPIVIILSVAFMYLLSVGLIMTTANII